MALGKNAKLDLISSVPLFARCSKGELKNIAALADEIDLAEGKVLIHEGERGREFFVLVEGRVDVTAKGVSVNTLEAGQFFGEMALVSDTPRNATVTALTPLRVLVITDRDFKHLLADSPAIQQKVMQALCDRLAELVDLGVA
jgi:CRP/FNR family transcriptional regulator, cyclic AMP receptor protein